MQGGSIKYSGAIDALRSVLKVEGVSGLYRGLWPNLCGLGILMRLEPEANEIVLQ